MEEWQRLLKDKGYTMDDVDSVFARAIEQLKQKRTMREKRPLGGYVKHTVGKFVTLRQSDYPIKMFVLQEIYDEPYSYIRIGYYIIKLKTLKETGKLQVGWGQFNPSIPKKDLKDLLSLAKKEGILNQSPRL